MPNENKKPQSAQGWIFIVLGIVSISLRFINFSGQWRMVDVVKLVLGIVLIVYGIVMLVKAKKNNQETK